MIRVHVIDDHPVVRQGVGVLFEGDGDIAVEGGSSTATEGIARVAASQPDVVLLDVRLTGADVVSTVRQLRDHAPGTWVVLFTADPDHPSIPAARRAGAIATVSKDVSPGALRGIVRDAAAGRLVASPVPAETEVLTPRQRQVLALVAVGMTNGEIAAELRLRPETVKDYWKLTMQRLGVRNRAEAIAHAYRSGLL